MYGRSGKLGRVLRGGGRGSNPSFPPPLNRVSVSSAGSRLFTANSHSPAASATPEENFSLVSGKCPPPFAMIIRLTPDLVDEISRVEDQGKETRIKFDSCANNTSGNVIDVGGKDFGFTWSSEMGDLCDIYEEHQSVVKENGLLVESGSAWRKLNVQRVLDESMTNHVKMRTVEAERKLKARKAIVLDHGKSSMKSLKNPLATAETKPKNLHFKQNKAPALKKRKFDPYQAGVSTEPAVKKFTVSLTANEYPKQSTLPLTSPPDQSVAPASQTRTAVITKSNAIVGDIISTPLITEGKILNKENETPSTTQSMSRGTPVSNGKNREKLMDLKSMLISLLKANHKGMHLESLVKAIKDRLPNTKREIHFILKKIAIVKAQGLYFLKPGVELESFKKPNTDSGSSPEDMRKKPALEDNHADQTTVSKASIFEKIAKHQEETQLTTNRGEKLTISEKINTQHQPLNLLGEKSVSEYNGEQAGHSSDIRIDSSNSGSDSEIDSQSTVGSVSGSGDSEKEESDHDVDIMTIDDAEKPMVELGMGQPGLSVQNEVDERQADHRFSAVEIARIMPNDQETEIPVPPVLHTKTCLSNYDEKENQFTVGFVHEDSYSTKRVPKSKSKRHPDLKHFDKETMPFPPTISEVVPTNPNAILKNRTLVQNAEDKKTSRFSIADHTKDGPRSSILADTSTKVRQSKSGRTEAIGSEGYRETQKENRMQPSIRASNSTNEQVDATILQKSNVVQKGTDTYSDENVSSYLKYEKDEPELKGPIKDFPQYEEYVKEYRDKYGTYCSLDKTLETERNHFWKLGKNLDVFKGKDTRKYNHLLGQLKDSYHQYRLRHKRLKKVFIVLHEELVSLKERIKDYALQYTNG